jgi:hypothetical protein
MKTYKYCILMIFLLSLGLLNGCQEDFLEEEKFDIVTPDNFWKNDADAKTGVTSVYNTLINGEDTYKRFIWMGAELPGEAANNNNGGGSRQEMNDYTWNKSTDFVLRIWRGLFVGVRRANNVLLNIENVKFNDPTLKPVLIAETKCLRALFYLDLMRFYDHVPYITETENFNEIQVSNEGTDDKVWQLIESDLAFAIANLPPKREAKENGRVTQGTAKALLTRAYATQAGYPWNKPGYWAKTAAQADDIITNAGLYGYQLLADFADNFNVLKEANSEYILSAEFTSGASLGNDRPALTGVRGMWVKPTDGWSSIISDVPFYRTYAATDKRRSKTFLLSFTDAKSGKLQQFDPDNADASLKLAHFAKYQDPNDNKSTGTGDFGCNQIIMRYADVLLLQSEAENEATGPSNKSIYGINRVRLRAGLDTVSNTLSQDELRKAIIRERVWEFAAEGQVFFDYKRQHCVSDRVKIITDKYYVLPIHQDELSANPKLAQHPLWK